jgi:hypothetical protein
MLGSAKAVLEAVMRLAERIPVPQPVEALEMGTVVFSQ